MATFKEAIREILESVIIAVIVAFFVITFIVQAFYIPSSSMEPTLKPGDRILVNKFIYRFKEPQRGDVIVFQYPVDPKRDFIKRLIGLPGETFDIKDGYVNINGKKIDEPYLDQQTFREGEVELPVKVEKNHFFMMGDNRSNSEDSRYWGQLSRKNIVGKAMLVYWPLNRIKIIR